MLTRRYLSRVLWRFQSWLMRKRLPEEHKALIRQREEARKSHRQTRAINAAIRAHAHQGLKQ